jgi:paraquat-inducible protein A
MHRRSDALRSIRRTAALALAAILLYPIAISVPMLRIEELGHMSEASILEGVTTLFAEGQLVVAVIVLLCSVVFPLSKLLGLLVLTTRAVPLATRHKALTYSIIEWTGRWGMLDVLLVAVLVAVLKLGSSIEVSVGPAAVAFASCVVLSLLAAAAFDPHALWENQA